MNGSGRMIEYAEEVVCAECTQLRECVRVMWEQRVSAVEGDVGTECDIEICGLGRGMEEGHVWSLDCRYESGCICG